MVMRMGDSAWVTAGLGELGMWAMVVLRGLGFGQVAVGLQKLEVWA
jgi:hypothetical protein